MGACCEFLKIILIFEVDKNWYFKLILKRSGIQNKKYFILDHSMRLTLQLFVIFVRERTVLKAVVPETGKYYKPQRLRLV